MVSQELPRAVIYWGPLQTSASDVTQDGSCRGCQLLTVVTSPEREKSVRSEAKEEWNQECMLESCRWLHSVATI